MASNLYGEGDTSGTHYFRVHRLSDDAPWNGSAFESWSDGNIGNYDITATRQGTSNRFIGTNPASTTAIRYALYKQSGGSPAVGDELRWEDKAGPLDANTTLIEGTDATDQITTYAGGGSSLTAADVWTYATRTTTGPAATYSPTHAYGQLRLIRGESYGTGAAKDLTTGVSNGGTWPTDLDAYTWTFKAEPHASNTTGTSWTGTVTVVTGTGSSRSVRITITASVTAAVASGKYEYTLQGTKSADTTIKSVPEQGVVVLEDNHTL